MSDEIKTIREALEDARIVVGNTHLIEAALSALDQLTPTAEKVDIPEAIKAFKFVKEIGERKSLNNHDIDHHKWLMVRWANHGIASLTP